jgi:hypothetical protein
MVNKKTRAPKTKVSKKTRAPKTIRAVAISNNQTSRVINDANANTLRGVRPYIKGLIHRLDMLGYEIGNYYVIDYRECTAGQLANNLGGSPDCVLCMSTTVLDAAVANVPSSIPVIAIVSTPADYPQNNVCGISGQRHQIAKRYYDRFLQTVPALQTVYVLHKDNYGPSDKSLREIGGGSHTVPFHSAAVSSPYRDADIQAAINRIPTQAQSGLLTGLIILPADSFFGAAQNIINWAHNRGLGDFWPTTDLVRASSSSALGGYGVAQARCGEKLADQIAYIWLTGSVPTNPRFTQVDTNQRNGDVLWLASLGAAQQLNLTLGTEADLRKV